MTDPRKAMLDIVESRTYAHAPPTRDGAEGAGETREYQTSHGTVNLSIAVDAGLAAILDAASPKPAPDAMAARKACSDWAFNKEGEAIGYMLPQQAAREAFLLARNGGPPSPHPCRHPMGRSALSAE